MPKINAQDFLSFDNIREGIIILKNKSLRGILMVSSLNFALKSSEEQEAILYQFQNFLNSLDFSCQVLIHSRRLNFIGYLDKLEEIERKEPNNLLQLQIKEYRKFIQELLVESNIMQKSFYLIIPFALAEVEGKIFEGTKPTKKIFELTEEKFQRSKLQLWQRMEFVILGLRRCGLQALPLNTPEVVELLWSFYNPREAEKGYYPDFPPELFQ